MGIDKKRFKSDIQDVLICLLCQDVFEDPVMVIGDGVNCQHSFCRRCLEKHAEDRGMCPNKDCRLAIGDGDWTNNKTLEKMMSGLKLTCSFASLGCDKVIELSSLHNHTAKCQHNPDLTEACVGGCGVQLTKQQVNNHKCVEALKEEMIKMKGEMEKLRLASVNRFTEKRGTVLTDQQAQSRQFMLEDKIIRQKAKLKSLNAALDKKEATIGRLNKECENGVKNLETQLKKNEQLENDLKKCQLRVEELEKWEGVTKLHKEWLLKFPEKNTENHLQYIEKLKQKNRLKDSEIETVLKRLNRRNMIPLDDSESTPTINFFYWLMPMVLSTVKDNLLLGSSCLITDDVRCYFTACSALMIGPFGKIFTYFEDNEEYIKDNVDIQFIDKMINQIDIDYYSKRLSQNYKQLTDLTFDCIISHCSTMDLIDGFVDRLKPGGRMIKFKADTFDSFCLVEKRMDGKIKRYSCEK